MKSQGNKKLRRHYAKEKAVAQKNKNLKMRKVKNDSFEVTLSFQGETFTFFSSDVERARELGGTFPVFHKPVNQPSKKRKARPSSQVDQIADE